MGSETTKSTLMEQLLKEEATPMANLKIGEIIETRVIEISRQRLFLDLGGYKVGVVYGREFKEASSIIKTLNPGDTVHAIVTAPENEDGYIELSLKEASRERAWETLKRILASGEVITTRIREANRGGLIVELEGVQGFLPVSQLSFAHYPRVEGGDKQKIFQELQKFIGKDLRVKIIDLDQREQKVIISEKAAEGRELQEMLAKYRVGDRVEGTVSGVVDFGAFVKLADNLEGLAHISELDWQLVEDPHDLVKVGDKVGAQIIGIEDDRVSLSIKRLKPNPWDTVQEKYHAGDVVKARVIKFNPFGAFAKLDNEIHGLAHVSEFGSEEQMKQALELGKEYEFRILSLEPKEYKLALGLV